ncbi:hypothetical protein GCM10025866_33990 [Naasia aerilata]|uniref:SDR family NAD(P)-dependent oxidoreductase n=1 Tax=Naasia aerilata TaxID=1162966 RepID=A0ABN6XV09_9MICO|nr:hypothetical protein GCM10025866_33990 [Naasia aerilata]
MNVADRDQVREAAAATLAAVDRVDVLVNNAGVVTGKPLLEASEDQIQRTFDVNVLALYWVTRAFLPGMLTRRRGTVVTVASAAGLIGVARQTDYAASKHAAVGFDESLRAELRGSGRGVRTLVVCPYYIDTGMFEGSAPASPSAADPRSEARRPAGAGRDRVGPRSPAAPAAGAAGPRAAGAPGARLRCRRRPPRHQHLDGALHRACRPDRTHRRGRRRRRQVAVADARARTLTGCRR